MLITLLTGGILAVVVLNMLVLSAMQDVTDDY